MNLSGDVRESVSLDEEDELSDMDDEVFIRDGKKGYKFEDISAKKPLMAPRRKITKSSYSISTRIRTKHSCKLFYKLFCYVMVALAVMLGLLVLVIVLDAFLPVTIFKLKNWISYRFYQSNSENKIVQCTDFEVEEVWKIDFPKFTSETAVNAVDVDQDGIKDVIFGFSTGDGEIIPSDYFCPIFMNTTQSYCGGGIIALNGKNGTLIWKHWLPGPVLDLFCSTDFNNDNVSDCLLSGKSGLLRTINSINGKLIWDFPRDETVNRINVYQPSTIADFDNDNISDILATHSVEEKGKIVGNLAVISGKNGTLLKEILIPEGGAVSYCKPQKIGRFVLLGTGSLNKPGALILIDIDDILKGNSLNDSRILYKDDFKGILSSSVLVDVTGDGIEDIITATFNSTIIALNGSDFEMLWNYTIPNSESLSVPIPGYFNGDNVTDFLIKYQTGPGFPTYYYSQTFILDGRNGKPIFIEPFIDTTGVQMGGLTIRTENYGYDWFLYSTGDCKGHEGSQDVFEYLDEFEDEPADVKIRKQTQSDLCLLRYNSSTVVNIFALSQFDQPPGFLIYSSENNPFNSTAELFPNPVEEAREYFKKHTKKQVEDEVFNVKTEKPELKKQNLNTDADYERIPPEDWLSYPQNILDDVQLDSDDYLNPYLREPIKPKINSRRNNNNNNRDPRSKSEGRHGKALKKNLSDAKYGIYDFSNVRNSQKRLLSDLNSLPDQILKETYHVQNNKKLKKSKEVRDLNPQIKEEVEDKNNSTNKNVSLTLWDLESENEMRERNDVKDYWRGKREVEEVLRVPRTTAVGTLVKSLNKTSSGIDLILVTYWVPSSLETEILLKEDLKCIEDNYLKNVKIFEKKEYISVAKNCLSLRRTNRKQKQKKISDDSSMNFPFFNEISKLKFGVLSVRRLSIKCKCGVLRKGEKCVRFLDDKEQNWSSYLGKYSNGLFKTKK